VPEPMVKLAAFMGEPVVEVIEPAALNAPDNVKLDPNASVPETDIVVPENGAAVFSVPLIVLAPDGVIDAFKLNVPAVIPKVVQVVGAPSVTIPVV